MALETVHFTSGFIFPWGRTVKLASGFRPQDNARIMFFSGIIIIRLFELT